MKECNAFACHLSLCAQTCAGGDANNKQSKIPLYQEPMFRSSRHSLRSAMDVASCFGIATVSIGHAVRSHVFVFMVYTNPFQQHTCWYVLNSSEHLFAFGSSSLSSRCLRHDRHGNYLGFVCGGVR